MAIIYSYPTVIPTTNDLVLGTDVDQAGKPTKNFTIKSIVDIVSSGATGLGAVLKISSNAQDVTDPANPVNQPIQNLTFINGTGSATFGSFADGTMNITGGLGTGFTSITSTDFAGNITGIVKVGSSIAGAADGAEANNVIGVTQPVGTSNKTLATTEFVASRVDPSILTFLGTNGGDQTITLATQKFSIVGTTNQIQTDGTAQKLTIKFPAAGVTLPDGSTATTQAATDDSGKIATTAFVRNYDDTQDLDFSGDNASTGTVLLNSQALAISGTANQVVTAAAGQALTISLPATVIRNLQGNVTGILKDGSSIETTVTGVTQTAGNDSTRLATTAYVDGASGAKTLDYAGDTTGPFALNLSTDDLEFNGDSNITVTAAVVNAGNKGIVTIDLDDAVTITGKMQAGTLSDGTFSGSAGTYTGGVSIESDTFTATTTPIGFIGNATTATALAAPGTIQLLSGSGVTQGVSSGASTYTSGSNISLTTSLTNTTVTSKTLLGLPSFTTSSILATDTINQALAKLQGQINSAGGGGALSYEGAWRASVTAVANGALSSSTALVIATADANLVKGTVVEGAGITGTVRIDAITGTAVTLDTAITIADGITLTMSPPGGAITGATAGTAASLTTPANKLSGRFYICDTVGKAEPNAAVPWAAATTPNEWAVGDWVVYISNGSQPDEWQKLDQSNELFGSGAATKVALWTASNTLGTGLIADDGATVTIGSSGNLTVQGNTILGDSASADTIQLKGVTTFENYAVIKKGISLGDASSFGTSGQVLTSAGGSGANPPTWTAIPDTGVTDVDAGDGITIDKTDAAEPIIAIDYLGANNAIVEATAYAAADPIITTEDEIWFNDKNTNAGTPVLIDKIKRAKFEDLPFDNFAGWVLSDAESTPNTTTITKGAIAKFAGGTYITTGEASGVLTINHNATTRTDTTSTDGPAFGGTFEAVTSVTSNTTGHVTAVDVSTVTLPANPLMGVASAAAGGAQGLVPASATGDQLKFLRADRTWVVPTDLKGVETVNTTSPIEGGGSSAAVTVSHKAVLTDNSGNAGTYTMADVSVDGNGHITGIADGHGGGGGGTKKGGIFTKLYTTGTVAAGAATAFSISRATTGSMVFDVMFTGGTRASSSVTKKFTVVKQYGNADSFISTFKILDTGPGIGNTGTDDFTVDFEKKDTDGLGLNCTIAAVGKDTQKIGITINLGFGENDATVVMNA